VPLAAPPAPPPLGDAPEPEPAPAAPLARAPRAEEPAEEIELKPIILSRADTAAVESGDAAQERQRWWLISSAAARCLPTADDGGGAQGGGEEHPVRLLAAGCYIKQRSGGLMVIRCDDPASGVRTLEFAETLARCQEVLNPRDRAAAPSAPEPSSLTIPVVSVPSPVDPDDVPAVPAPPAPRAAEPPYDDPRPLAAGEREWHCLCYQEVYRRVASPSTSCRNSRETCLDLAAKIAEGTPLLVRGSMTVGCRRYAMRQPWDSFGIQDYWLPSTEPGSWWTPRGCFLDGSVAHLTPPRAGVPRAPAPRAPTPAAPAAPALPARGTLKPAEAESCDLACWAHLAPKGDLARRLGGDDVPKALEWGRPFADRVNLLLKTCVARREKRGPSPSGRQACLDEGVKACARFCERSKG